VVAWDAHGFDADVSNETLALTTLGGLPIGAAVNLERSLLPTTRLGGHLVSGHVDAVGAVEKVWDDGRSQRWRFTAPRGVLRYVAAKGSIAVDGTSLTVNAVDDTGFEVNLVPHTVAHTAFGETAVGAAVNLEVDTIARYVERLLATREESIKLAKLRLDNGVSSELDYHQAEGLTQAARATLAQQQRQRALDENALVLLLGQSLPPEVLATVNGYRLADTPAMAALPAGLPSDLLTRRPDIRQAEQTLLASNANIGAARAAFFPRISLTASVGSVSSELSGLFKSGSWAFSLAPQLVLPIFDAGRNQAGLDSAQAGRAIAVAQYEKAIQTAFREVADALAGQATLTDQLNAQKAQSDAEAKRLKLSDLRYRNGVASYLDFLDAQRSLFSTQQAVVQTRLVQLQNQVALYKTLGGGWTETGTAPVAQ